MKTEIDWSKAPEDATHWEPDGKYSRQGWMKLEGGRWSFWHSYNAWQVHSENPVAERISSMIARPATWLGEGLPPVGTVCEYRSGDHWYKVEITYLSEWVLVLRCLEARPGSHFAEVGVELAKDAFCVDVKNAFRPLRTPAQIAAEEREKAVQEMVGALQVSENLSATAEFIVCGILYDAGYRKSISSQLPSPPGSTTNAAVTGTSSGPDCCASTASP